MSNVHPVDRMATIKTQIDDLKDEFGRLRQLLLDGHFEPIGDEWRAVITPRVWRFIRVSDAEKILPPELFEAVINESDQRAVTFKSKRGKRA